MLIPISDMVGYVSTPASSHGAAMHPVRQRGRALAIVRGTLATQSVVTGWGGLIAIFLGDLTATGGRQWVLLAAGVAGGGAALLGVAAGLWALRASLLNGQARWTITVLAIEAALVPAGWLMMGLWTSATPAAGTDR